MDPWRPLRRGDPQQDVSKEPVMGRIRSSTDIERIAQEQNLRRLLRPELRKEVLAEERIEPRHRLGADMGIRQKEPHRIVRSLCLPTAAA